MPSVVENFVDFMNKNTDKFANADVDISPFLETINQNTPIMIKYSDPEAAFIDMPSIILKNFCQCLVGKKFPMFGLLALKDIVTKNVEDENNRLVLMLMVHVTKLDLSISESAIYFAKFTPTTSDVQTDEAKIWHDIGCLVLAHKTINDTVNQLIQDAFGQQLASRVLETQSIPVSVKLVDSESELRGFAGLGVAHINYEYFSVKQRRLGFYKFDESAKTNILLIDVATAVIHEYAHVRARQVTDDFNHSTPNFLVNTPSETDPEFGRMAERAFFRAAIDWEKSYLSGAVSAKYMQRFLDAIKNGTELPTFPADTNVITRCCPKVMRNSGGAGVDIEPVQSVIE